ncbi:hypothetical protein BASA62_003325 [Batrachochytrium salamandrivorans]|nr:hypothetical protein BASA62_003325 [Batrachochytrium salamandrivorans]
MRGEEQSKLPAGVNSFEARPPTQFCREFGNVAAADGTQRKNGGRSCSSMEQGLIPDVSKMVSTLITSPESGARLDASKDNKVTLDVSNLESRILQ